MPNLFHKLVAVRASIEFIKKEKESGQGRFAYNYVGSDDVLIAIKEAMDEQGVMVLPSVVETDIRDHKTKNGDHQYFTVCTLEFTVVNADDPADRVVLRGHGQGLDTGEKGIGKALTYAEKYFFLKLFNIPTPKDDPDATQNRPQQHRNDQPGQDNGGGCTEKQRKMIWAIACKAWPDVEQGERSDMIAIQCHDLGIPESTGEMSKDQASRLIKRLDSVKEQMGGAQ